MKYSLVSDIMYVSVGANGPIWPDTDGILASMELAKKYGLAGVEFWDWESRDLQAICAKKSALGLEIAAICAKGGEALGDSARIDEMVAGFAQTLDAARMLGCRGIILNANAYPVDAPREQVHQAMVDGLRAVAPLAEANDVCALIEPISGGYFHNSQEPFSLVEEVGSANVKVLYDIFHFQKMEGNILPTIKQYLPLIGHIHGAGAPDRCELTEGELNYAYLLNALKDLGYEGWFGLEHFTFHHREEKVAASCSILV